MLTLSLDALRDEASSLYAQAKAAGFDRDRCEGSLGNAAWSAAIAATCATARISSPRGLSIDDKAALVTAAGLLVLTALNLKDEYCETQYGTPLTQASA